MAFGGSSFGAATKSSEAMSMSSLWAQLRGGVRRNSRKSNDEKENQDPPNNEEKELKDSHGTSKAETFGTTTESEYRTHSVHFKSLHSDFKTPSHLTLLKGIGAGAYGMVAAFKDSRTGKSMGIKKITRAFDDLADGKRILREIKLLGGFNHENIVGLVGLYAPGGPDFEDIYICIELMEMDLSRVIKSGEPLGEEHHRWMTYQILLGTLYMHSAGVVHRDLKPSNILVNRDCTIKICDFGLARGSVQSVYLGGEIVKEHQDAPNNKLTEYVVTRYYRAPEVVLLASEYGHSIDVWSVGCILCEMIGRKPIFKGKDHLDQIEQIINVLGSPSQEDMNWLQTSPSACRFLARFGEKPKKQWEQVYPEASPKAISAINAMVRFHPAKRSTAKDAVRLPYFEEVYRQEDVVVRELPLDWAFDAFVPTRHTLQERIRAECLRIGSPAGTVDPQGSDKHQGVASL